MAATTAPLAMTCRRGCRGCRGDAAAAAAAAAAGAAATTAADAAAAAAAAAATAAAAAAAAAEVATTCSYHSGSRSGSGSRSRSRSSLSVDSQLTTEYSPVLLPGKREEVASAGRTLSLSWHLPNRELQRQPWQSLAELCRVLRTPERERQLRRQVSDATTITYAHPAWSAGAQMSQDSQDQDLSGF
jgi:hypothetical protein